MTYIKLLEEKPYGQHVESYGMTPATSRFHLSAFRTHQTSGTQDDRRSRVQASLDWLTGSGAEFSPGIGRSGLAHLTNYTARYCIWGDGPPLVLVPGLAGGFELLGPLARLLAKQNQVISYQLRGEDDCFSLRRRFDLTALVDDLRELLDWFGLERPPVLGVSFGGVLALELAMRWPHRLERLITQGVGARYERGLLQQVAGWVLARYPLPSDSPFVNQFFNLLFGARQKPGPLFEFVTRQCWQTDQSVITHRFHLVEAFNPGSRLNAVHVPTLLMAGDRDLLVSPRSLQELVRSIPNAISASLPGCGHLAFVTQPERVADEVKRFLAD
jgi:pimeloyl-ACP methyl ester carboxylesterase